MEAVYNFACELLWDNWQSITQIFRQLVAKRRQLREQFGDKPVSCSFRAAALLLDIGAYKKCGESDSVRQRVHKLVYESAGDAASISHHKGTGRLVGKDEDFGLFQSLIWQLTVPVRRDLLQTQAPALCRVSGDGGPARFPRRGQRVYQCGPAYRRPTSRRQGQAADRGAQARQDGVGRRDRRAATWTSTGFRS